MRIEGCLKVQSSTMLMVHTLRRKRYDSSDIPSSYTVLYILFTPQSMKCMKLPHIIVEHMTLPKMGF